MGLTLAIDIVEELGTSFDGMATMGCLAVPPTPYILNGTISPWKNGSEASNST